MVFLSWSVAMEGRENLYSIHDCVLEQPHRSCSPYLLHTLDAKCGSNLQTNKQALSFHASFWWTWKGQTTNQTTCIIDINTKRIDYMRRCPKESIHSINTHWLIITLIIMIKHLIMDVQWNSIEVTMIYWGSGIVLVKINDIQHAHGKRFAWGSGKFLTNSQFACQQLSPSSTGIGKKILEIIP